MSEHPSKGEIIFVCQNTYGKILLPYDKRDEFKLYNDIFNVKEHKITKQPKLSIMYDEYNAYNHQHHHSFYNQFYLSQLTPTTHFDAKKDAKNNLKRAFREASENLSAKEMEQLWMMFKFKDLLE